jgi:hypothetical protein
MVDFGPDSFVRLDNDRRFIPSGIGIPAPEVHLGLLCSIEVLVWPVAIDVQVKAVGVRNQVPAAVDAVEVQTTLSITLS